jgi:hypothetical protein
VKKHTAILHRSLIRLAKGLLKAWEEWIDAAESAASN